MGFLNQLEEQAQSLKSRQAALNQDVVASGSAIPRQRA